MLNDIRLEKLYLRISVNQYHFLKFILEGYDGIGVLSHESNKLVVIRYPREQKNVLYQLLSSLDKKIQYRKHSVFEK
jgi:hypothetical protein